MAVNPGLCARMEGRPAIQPRGHLAFLGQSRSAENSKAKSRAGSPGSSLHVLSVSFTASGTEQSFLTGLHHHCQALQLALQHVNRAARLLHSRGGIDGGI